MGVYAITGGSGGIGLRVISQLEKQGHETINIDWKTGDIQADLSIPEGLMRRRSWFLSRSAPDPFFKLFRNDFYYKRGLRSFREKRRQLRSHCFQCYLPGRPAHGLGRYFK